MEWRPQGGTGGGVDEAQAAAASAVQGNASARPPILSLPSPRRSQAFGRRYNLSSRQEGPDRGGPSPTSYKAADDGATLASAPDGAQGAQGATPPATVAALDSDGSDLTAPELQLPLVSARRLARLRIQRDDARARAHAWQQLLTYIRESSCFVHAFGIPISPAVFSVAIAVFVVLAGAAGSVAYAGRNLE